MVHILGLDRPVRREAVFDASAGDPAGVVAYGATACTGSVIRFYLEAAYSQSASRVDKQVIEAVACAGADGGQPFRIARACQWTPEKQGRNLIRI